MNKKSAEKKTKRELTDFQIRDIRLLAIFLEHDAYNEEALEILRDNEVEYLSLLEKIKTLEQKVNLDEKTNLLKFRPDYLSNIIKTVSRVYDGLKDRKFEISLVRFDIDDFSKFNNQYGHETGDRVLVAIANLLKECSRPTDYVIRFGGEEFDVILPATNLDGTMVYVKKIMKRLRTIHVPVHNKKLRVTMSAGISTYQHSFSRDKYVDEPNLRKAYALLQDSADNALYEAKYNGKDQFATYAAGKKTEYAKIRKLYVK
jgi:two-component system, cell cycle response regulator